MICLLFYFLHAQCIVLYNVSSPVEDAAVVVVAVAQ